MRGRSAATIGRAAVLAGVLSGAPSTAHALLTGKPLLTATRAAGALLGRPGVVRGAVAHVVLTWWWTSVLALVLPGRRTVAWGAVAGSVIGALDLGVARRRFPAIAALPRRAQLADHVAFGTVVGAVLAAPTRRARR